MAAQVVVRIEGLSYSYTPAVSGSEVLRDINIDITRAARVVLVGENGAGKSTLLNLIAGKMMIPQNTIMVMGQDAFRCTKLQNVVSLISAEWSVAVGAMHTVTFKELMSAVLNTVESSMLELVTARANRLKALLGVDEEWQIGATSEGQRRRAQLVLKLMLPRGVVMLDEATTDLDIIARQNLLQFLFEESDKRSVTVIYCTHIFDGMEGWATHAAHVGQRTILRVQECGQEPGLAGLAEGGMYEVVKRWMEESSTAKPLPSRLQPAARGSASAVCAPETAACDVKKLTWGYRARVLALRGASCRVPQGSRCLVTGGNGAGKSTLLSIIAGKHRVDPDSVTILGFRAFEDYRALGNAVQLLSQEWRQTLRCVGVAGNLTFKDLTASVLAHLDAEVSKDEVVSRLEALQAVMQVDPTWACNEVSDGQLRRMQLVIKLATPCKVVLLDEASVDLDILGRDALLQFLRQESEERGVTVLYCTHILDGLEGWASHHIHLHAGTVSLERAIEGGAAAGGGPTDGKASVGSRLYQLVQGILRRDAAAVSANEDAATVAGGEAVVVPPEGFEQLPYGWMRRQATLPGAYGSNVWDDKDDGLKEPTIRPWLGEGDLLEDDTDLSAWAGAAPLPEREATQTPAAAAAAAPLQQAPTVHSPAAAATDPSPAGGPGAAGAGGGAKPLGEAELKQVEMLEGLVGTAVEKLGEEVGTLAAAVKSRDGGRLDAARRQAKVLWDGLQPALQKLEELLGKPDGGDEAITYAQFLAEQGGPASSPAGTADGGGGGGSELPWGFGSRHNQVSEVELQRQGRVLAERPTAGTSAPVGGGGREELPFGFGARHNQTAPEELMRQGKLLPERPSQ